jgi:DNA phosphorothioation-associated putative methyltransferase
MRSFHPTAIARKKLSMPMRTLIEKGIIDRDDYILDYGTGRGDCIKHLRRQLKYHASYGYDPNMPTPDTFFLLNNRDQITKEINFKTVTLIYVLNVIENIEERKKVLSDAFHLATNYLAIAVRTEKIPGTTKGDGVITKRKTFQRRYNTKELIAFITSTLGEAFKPTMLRVIKPGLVVITKGQSHVETTYR